MAARYEVHECKNSLVGFVDFLGYERGNVVKETNNKLIKIKYFDKKIDKVEKIEQGDWIDLRTAATIYLDAGDSTLIPLGVGMILPNGCEAHVVPRSSTFKNYGIIQTNGMGIIDESYCGNDDQWFMPVYATRRATIPKNSRICQFRIVEKMPEYKIEEVENLEEKSRGGHGSTGK